MAALMAGAVILIFVGWLVHRVAGVPAWGESWGLQVLPAAGISYGIMNLST